VQYVESDRAPYAYTVGLREHGLPELLVTGLPPERTARLLDNGGVRQPVLGVRPDLAA